MLHHEFNKLPRDSVPFQGFTASDITGTTPVAIAAAPGAGKSFYVTKLILVNKTAAEVPVIDIQDTTGSPIILSEVALAAGPSLLIVDFDPPLVVGNNKGLNAKATTAVGDTRITAMGYVGTMPS